MIHFQISDELTLDPDDRRALEGLLIRTAEQALAQASSTARADLTLVLAEDEQLHELNRVYLGIDSPTDVLAFPSGDIDPETENLYLGDVIVSLPRAAEQAARGGHPLNAELQLLVVHGVLHLCGYDHDQLENKLKMWDLQRSILRSLECPIEGPSPQAEQ